MKIAKIILRNTLSNWTGITINTIITILLTPYILNRLGAERYGIFSIVFGIMHYMVLLEFGIRGAVARFASKYIQSQNTSSLSGVISITVMFSLGLGTVSILLGYGIGLVALDFFHISADYHTQTLILFVAFGMNMMLSLLAYSLSGVLIGSQRYDLLNIQHIMSDLLRVLFVVVFFSFGWISLSGWAAAIVLASVCGLLYLLYTSHYLQPKLTISMKAIKMDILKEMLSFSGWNIFLQLSWLITCSANPIIIGKFISAEMVPLYSIPFMLVTRLQTAVGGLTSTLMPHASSALNTGDKDALAHLLKRGTYMASSLVFPIGGLLLVMCKSLFNVWLPAGYENSWMIFAILMVSFSGSITQTTSYYILLGGGDIRGIAIGYILAAISSVALGIYFVYYLAWGIAGAAIALVIPNFISYCIFQPWCASKQVGLSLRRYLAESYIRPILCSLPSIALGCLMVNLLPPPNLIVWAAEFFIALIPIAIFVLTGVLNWPLRASILSKIRAFLKIGVVNE